MSTKPLKIVAILAAVWTVAFATHLGCESTGSESLDPTMNLTGSQPSITKIEALLAKAPMFMAPDSTTRRTSMVDVSSQIPASAETAQFEIDTQYLDVTVSEPATGLVRTFAIDVIVGDRDAGDAVTVGRYLIEVDPAGDLVNRQFDAPTFDGRLINKLRGGDVPVEVVLRDGFRGIVNIDGVIIKISSLGGGTPTSGSIGVGGNTNDNTSGNANDNTGDNANDNTDDNGNDNTAGNTNDNTDDNSNDNTGDNVNDNTDNNGNDNADDNSNDNTDDNSNDNVADNANDNTDDNSNDNTDDNSNDNSDDNSNDNVDEGVCTDGSIQLRREIEGPGGFEVEVEYRALGENCRRFRLDIEGFESGLHDVLAAGVHVGQIFADSDDGEGRLRLETDDGNFPAQFPDLFEGDTVTVGDVDVVLQVHCSEAFLCDNMNGNGNDNGNDNTDDNSNDNVGGNTNDNTGDNSNVNG